MGAALCNAGFPVGISPHSSIHKGPNLTHLFLRTTSLVSSSNIFKYMHFYLLTVARCWGAFCLFQFLRRDIWYCFLWRKSVFRSYSDHSNSDHSTSSVFIGQMKAAGWTAGLADEFNSSSSRTRVIFPGPFRGFWKCCARMLTDGFCSLQEVSVPCAALQTQCKPSMSGLMCLWRVTTHCTHRLWVWVNSLLCDTLGMHKSLMSSGLDMRAQEWFMCMYLIATFWMLRCPGCWSPEKLLLLSKHMKS